VITVKEYNDFVLSTKVYPEKSAIVYPALGLTGEAGEVAEKVKKWLRGDRELDKLELAKEVSDVCWYVTSLADDLGYTLEEILYLNRAKLQDRKERNVIKGSGDNR
jgi:NTP pyrophosphatase (non-canonical NTP hydrolase)